MRLYVDQIVDDGEVGRVRCQQWNVVDVRGCGDYEIDDSSAWLSAALGDRGGKSAPLACYRGVDRQRVERCLDHAKSLCTPGAFVRVRGDQYAEMQLGQRGDADRCLHVGGGADAYQHGCIE